MNCVICNKQINSGTFIFVRTQKRVICKECSTKLDRLDPQAKRTLDDMATSYIEKEVQK